jgi:hypothetical protein
MRILLAMLVACLMTGSWHWQTLTIGSNARVIFTGGMTLDARAAPFTPVATDTSL